MKEEKLYSEWEYEEENEEEEQAGDPNEDPENTPDPNEEEEGASGEEENPVSDDTPVEIEVDGKKETVTLAEMKSGYMRQSDYTRKTQELKTQMESATPTEKKEVVGEAQKVVDNPESFPDEDVKTAKYLIDIAKKEFGLMTREQYDAEEGKKKILSDFSARIESDKKEIVKMKGMPAPDEDKVLDHMQETGINNFKAAYLDMNDATYRDFIIKRSKGSKSYNSDTKGKKPEPKDKEVDVRTDEGHKSFLADELKKMQS